MTTVELRAQSAVAEELPHIEVELISRYFGSNAGTYITPNPMRNGQHPNGCGPNSAVTSNCHHSEPRLHC